VNVAISDKPVTSQQKTAAHRQRQFTASRRLAAAAAAAADIVCNCSLRVYTQTLTANISLSIVISNIHRKLFGFH